MNISAYLQRIQYSGAVVPTLPVLTQLQACHQLSVPFENLDIHRQVTIDLSNLYDKIVTRRRGGFCYELNGLFYELLKAIGFSVCMVSARVYHPNNGYGPEFDHMALLVEIENDYWLADVGFGDFSLHPIKINVGEITEDPSGIFIIEHFDEAYKKVKRKDAEGNFIPEYIFTTTSRQLDDFNAMCIYHQTSLASHFTKNKICSLPTSNGRITLTGNTLKITANNQTIITQLNSETEEQQALQHHFNIIL